MSKAAENKTSANITCSSSPNGPVGDPGFRTTGFPIKALGNDEGSVRRFKPYPTYKDSGVEWLGEVPEKWSVSAVKRNYEIQLGKMLQNNSASDDDELVPYLKALHVLWGHVRTDDLSEMWASPSEVKQYGVQCGDLLVCEGGEVGRAGLLESCPEKGIIQNALHRVRAIDICINNGKYASSVLYYGS